MSDPIKKQEGVLQKVSRRSWLRNAAIAATGVIMLFLTGCTKEQWDHLGKTPHPGGGLGSTPEQWYYLKVNFKERDGREGVGYMSKVSGQGIINDSYMQVGVIDIARIRLHPAGDGWAFWELSDGTWLSLSYIGWLYRSDSTNRVAWKIVDGKLYNLYWDKVNWQEYPAGTQITQVGDFNTYPIWYIGVKLGDVLKNCQLVPVP